MKCHLVNKWFTRHILSVRTTGSCTSTDRVRESFYDNTWYISLLMFDASASGTDDRGAVVHHTQYIYATCRS